ncbi:MAG: hypothetical protein KGP28_01885 [Bdellovibrionales bacterium]|nr:hypothetical protein [Bdellovibrionales bacterium]
MRVSKKTSSIFVFKPLFCVGFVLLSFSASAQFPPPLRHDPSDAAKPDQTLQKPKPPPKDDCTNVDLNEAKDSPLRKIPVYDQDGSGTCAAHAAAQVLDYWLIEKGYQSKSEINPIYAAWVDLYESRYFPSDFGSGSSSFKVISSLKEKGICSKKYVAHALHELKTTGNLTDAELVHFLELSAHNLENSRTEARALAETKKDRYLYACRFEDLYHLLQVKKWLGLTAGDVLEKLFDVCPPRSPLKGIPDPVEFKFGSDSEIQAVMDRGLDEKKPTLIALCSGVLNNPSFRGLKGLSSPVNRMSTFNTKDDCEPHEVVLTARRRVGNSCKYLVRNSWGADWRPPSSECACITESGNYVKTCDLYEEREFVGCWYDEKDLVPNTGRVTLFSERKK